MMIHVFSSNNTLGKFRFSGLHLVGGVASNHAPGVIDLARLNGLDPVKDGLGDVAQPRRSDGNGNIDALVTDATSENFDRQYSADHNSRHSQTNLLTALTMAAVPLPKTSLSLPCFWYSTNWGMVMCFSETTKLDVGRPSTWTSPAACSRQMVRTLLSSSQQSSCQSTVYGSDTHDAGLPISCHTGQDQVFQRRGDELGLSLFILDDDKEVHRPDLGQVVFRSVQPQVLSVTLLGSLELGHDAWGVAVAEASGSVAIPQ